MLLVGDSEFSAVAVLKLLKKWQWQYVLRQKGRYLYRQNNQCAFQRWDNLITKPKQRVWLEAGQLTEKHAHSTHILVEWQPNEKSPWLLATNLTCPQAALKAYHRRMWVETFWRYEA